MMMNSIYKILFCIIFAIFGFGCSGNISLKTELLDKDQIYILRSRNIHSLYRMSIWNIDTNDYMWCIQSPSKNLPKRITYGKIPTGMKQVYPENNNQPGQLRPGENIAISLEYTYDFPVPSAATKEYSFRVSEDGSLEHSSRHIVKRPPRIEE